MKVGPSSVVFGAAGAALCLLVAAAGSALAAESDLVTTEVPGVVLTAVFAPVKDGPDGQKDDAIAELGDAPYSSNIQLLIDRCSSGRPLFAVDKGRTPIPCGVNRGEGYVQLVLRNYTAQGGFLTLGTRPFFDPHFTVSVLAKDERAKVEAQIEKPVDAHGSSSPATESLPPPRGDQPVHDWVIRQGKNTWYVLTDDCEARDMFDDPVPCLDTRIYRSVAGKPVVVGQFGGAMESAANLAGDGVPAIMMEDELGQSASYIRLLPQPEEVMRWENPND